MSSTETAPVAGPKADPGETGVAIRDRPATRTLGGYVATPLFIAVVLVSLYFYISGQDLGASVNRFLTSDLIITKTLEHIQLSLVSTVLVLAIAIPMGILLTRDFAAKATGPVLAVFNTGQATPSIGVLALIAAILGRVGFWAAIFGLVTYAALAVLRNTMVGLTQVDEAVLESGRGMGMTKIGVLLRLELPLAVPIILAGVRTALVLTVGSATLATYVAAGGLGEIIAFGIGFNRPAVTLVGAALAASLALMIDYIAGIAEDFLRPRGL
ncbi:MAG: ABC transporter permease [Euzebya sp.]